MKTQTRTYRYREIFLHTDRQRGTQERSQVEGHIPIQRDTHIRRHVDGHHHGGTNVVQIYNLEVTHTDTRETMYRHIPTQTDVHTPRDKYAVTDAKI
jgi:hypothetical protein